VVKLQKVFTRSGPNMNCPMDDITDINRLKRAINDSSKLSRLGEKQRALKLLDNFIAEAILENRGIWIRVLSRHASVICDSAGDLTLVKHYCEQALAHVPDDPMMLFSLADVSSRQGEVGLAMQYAVKSYDICVKRGSPEDRFIAELIIKRWPEINESGTINRG
jgi:hypothetical protein